MKKGLVFGLVLALVCLVALPIAVFAASPTNVTMTWSGTNVNVGDTVKLGDDQVTSFQSAGSTGAGIFTATFLPGCGDKTVSSIDAVTMGNGGTTYSVTSNHSSVKTVVGSSCGVTSIDDKTTTSDDSISNFTFDQTVCGKSAIDGVLAYVGKNSIDAGMSAGFGDLTIKGYLIKTQK